MKVLCTGDIHIGRRPSHAPRDTSRSSSGRAFEQLCDYAIRSQVDVVAISGDIIDKGNRFFEASAPLENGLLRLAEQGIDTVAVAGNHDFDALPRFVDAVRPPRFHLLGQGGFWESVTIEREQHGAVRFDGWSFPAEHVRTNPLHDYNLAPAPYPTIGLLHADFDVSDSVYAPIRGIDLDIGHLSGWILGHIHRPGFVKWTRPWAIYPGSPQGLDPGEHGAHGPWMLDLSETTPSPVHVHLAAMRYERIPFDVTDVTTDTEFQARLMLAVRAHVAAVRAGAINPVDHLVFRLSGIGRTAQRRVLEKCAADLLAQDQIIDLDGCTVAIESIDLSTAGPVYDLNEISRSVGPPGVLARMLIAIESGDDTDETSELMRLATAKTDQVASQPVYASLGAGVDHANLRAMLLRQGYRALDSLLAQKEQA